MQKNQISFKSSLLKLARSLNFATLAALAPISAMTATLAPVAVPAAQFFVVNHAQAEISSLNFKSKLCPAESVSIEERAPGVSAHAADNEEFPYEYKLEVKAGHACVGERPSYLLETNSPPKSVGGKFSRKPGVTLGDFYLPEVVTKLSNGNVLFIEPAGLGIEVFNRSADVTVSGLVAGGEALTYKRYQFQPSAPANYPSALNFLEGTHRVRVAESGVILGSESYQLQNRPANWPKLIKDTYDSYALIKDGGDFSFSSAGKLVGNFYVKADNFELDLQKGYVVGNDDLKGLVGMGVIGKSGKINLAADFVTPSLVVNTTEYVTAKLAGKVVGHVQFSRAEVEVLPTATMQSLQLNMGLIDLKFDPALLVKRNQACDARGIDYYTRGVDEFEFGIETVDRIVEHVKNYKCDLAPVREALGNIAGDKEFVGIGNADLDSWPYLRLEVPAGQTWTLDLSRLLSPEAYQRRKVAGAIVGIMQINKEGSGKLVLTNTADPSLQTSLMVLDGEVEVAEKHLTLKPSDFYNIGKQRVETPETLYR